MPIDGKKKASAKGKAPLPSKKKIEDQIEGDDTEENEEGSEYDPIGSSTEESGSEDESNAEEESVADVIQKKSPKKEIKRSKKRGLEEEEYGIEAEEITVKKAKREDEKKHAATGPSVAGPSKKPAKKNELFNDSNLDCDLFKSAPTNVVSRRIRVASNLIVTCRMISQALNNLSYDYAAVTFQRKTQNEKMFEFIIPLNLTPRLIQAMQYIVAENPKFFDGEK